ncbi:MAG: UdgX family uracil-DNA binding protein [Alphaproteobacteria bacterium]|nr:UdgX family uracil-DNA binding protein [Alphaproteobacteria bacterium]
MRWQLIRTAGSCVDRAIREETAMTDERNPRDAAAPEPQTLADLDRLIAAAEPMVPGGTRAVLGEGPVGAPIAFVGEQPGDQEDLQGRPFVGPAGKLLDRALADAHIDRAAIYVTNAVKHFKFARSGKRRIHQKPTAGEVKRYRWWLMKELDLVRPRLVVALGATAVLALTGKALPIARARGEARFDGHRGYVTVHPSYLLRLKGEDEKRRAYAAFLADLKRVRTLVEDVPGGTNPVALARGLG